MRPMIDGKQHEWRAIATKTTAAIESKPMLFCEENVVEMLANKTGPATPEIDLQSPRTPIERPRMLGLTFIEMNVCKPMWYHTSPIPSDTNDACMTMFVAANAIVTKLPEMTRNAIMMPTFKPVMLFTHPPGVEAKALPTDRSDIVAEISERVMLKFFCRYNGTIVHTDSVVAMAHMNGRYAIGNSFLSKAPCDTCDCSRLTSDSMGKPTPEVATTSSVSLCCI